MQTIREKAPKTLGKTKIATAISLALTLTSAPQGVAAQESAALEEIVVTATRRAESEQDVAVALQAISSQKLEDLRIDNFEDYIALIPGVNATGQGPGKQEVFIRGVSPGRSPVRIASLGSEPGVANYLDDTPTSYAGRNIDFFATDLSRIEVLKGPQGTLFGASSQAGTLRLITNKPVLNEYQAGVTLDYSDTSGGDSSNSLEGYVNIPLVEDTLAFRLAAYNADEGGFIDNISATRQIPLTNPGLGDVTPSFRETINNDDIVENDFNDAEYTGFRTSLLYQINEDWSATVQYAHQVLDTEGVFEFEPDVSTDNDLNAQTFNEDFGEDEVDLLALTVSGVIGGLDVVYSGSYTERLFEGQTDYTGYANNGPFIPYYICAPGYDTCGSPSLFTESFFETERTVHELRVSSDNDGAWNFLAGIYYDDQETIERSNFVYPASIENGFSPNFPDPAAFASDPNVRDPGVTFFNDFLSDREELSFFGEISYQISDTLKATLGARRYSIDIGLTGQQGFGQRASGPEANSGRNVDLNLAGQTPTELSDTIFKFNLSWNVSDNTLLYATYSEGFRSGGFNRNGGEGIDGSSIPLFFDTDSADNYELGWKTQFFDNSLRFNGAVYYVDFSDLQQGVLDFDISNATFFTNVGDAEIKGFEFDVNWVATENLSVFGSFSYIDSELVELPEGIENISEEGSELPFAPETQATLGARYEQEFGAYTGFAQAVAKFTDSRFTSLEEEERFEVGSYTEVDASIGFSLDNWKASLYVDNLTNELGELTAGAIDDIFRVTPIRPRTVGIRVSYDFY